ncbi:MAG TPA: Na(+)-translocating NADH-quinone reductase subunit A [bacterium]|nr:Na(+)-translocating NADH-quinone reductase subunit A [bacterium]
MHRIRRGLDLPVNGKPAQHISTGRDVKTVALTGPDYAGMKPALSVSAGDRVKLGQVLFTDKKRPEIRFTAPGSGKIIAINRGEKRAFLSVVIELDGDDRVTFPAFSGAEIEKLSREKAVSRLLESGLWTALRARPFGGIADPAAAPASLFVTAMDTAPLAPGMGKILNGRETDFQTGLRILEKLTDGPVRVCKSPGDDIPVSEEGRIRIEEFSGPHPAGLAGTHIHLLDPVHAGKTVWYIGGQDTAALGRLFRTGEPDVERIVSLAGPSVRDPRLIRTRLGASLAELTDGELKPGNHRIISGSVLSGRTAEDALAFLGRYHQQVSVLPVDTERRLLGWLGPGWNLYSTKRILLSALFPKKKFDLTPNQHGGRRAMVPIGMYERVMPLDIQPTYLLRALAVDDIDESEKLGCLELDEEDLALCTFVCPCKIDHGANLRRVLTAIEKEG